MISVEFAQKLETENTALRFENSTLRAELTELNSKLAWLMEQLSINNNRMFGASSEKNMNSQIGLFEDGPREVELIAEKPPETKAERPKKKSELSTKLPKDLPVETIEVRLPEEERICPDCGGALHDIGSEVVRREVKIIPAKAEIREYNRHSYSCRNCEKAADDKPVPIVKAEMPAPLIKGAICAPETVAHIIVEKFVMGSPLYRQEQAWNRLGIMFYRQTMASWLIRVSIDYLEPIYDELHRKLLLHKFLHGDGTVFQVLDEPGKPPQSQSHMWVYRTSGDAEYPIILYDYQPDKTKERPRDFLDGFVGYLMTDGEAAYHSLPDSIVVVGCVSHVRRKFVDALKAIKNKKDRLGSNAQVGVDYCDELFRIEREMEVNSFEERHEVRNKVSEPTLENFKKWLISVQPHIAPKCATGKAVSYALNQWKYIERYLLDGCIEISNNRCERSVKPFVINRKNFLFASSVAGARAAAVLQSLTETAKENRLNPFEYFSYIFKKAAGYDLRENPDMIYALLPENVPNECRVN
jgi:transposase